MFQMKNHFFYEKKISYIQYAKYVMELMSSIDKDYYY